VRFKRWGSTYPFWQGGLERGQSVQRHDPRRHSGPKVLAIESTHGRHFRHLNVAGCTTIRLVLPSQYPLTAPVVHQAQPEDVLVHIAHVDPGIGRDVLRDPAGLILDRKLLRFKWRGDKPSRPRSPTERTGQTSCSSRRRGMAHKDDEWACRKRRRKKRDRDMLQGSRSFCCGQYRQARGGDEQVWRVKVSLESSATILDVLPADHEVRVVACDLIIPETREDAKRAYLSSWASAWTLLRRGGWHLWECCRPGRG
jgi:hypothetical protein